MNARRTPANPSTASTLRSATLAGLISFVIYVVIALATGAGLGAALGVGVVFLVGTAAVTFVVITVINARAARGPR